MTFRYLSAGSSSSVHDGPGEDGVFVKGGTVEEFEEGMREVRGVDGWVKGWVGRSLDRARGK